MKSINSILSENVLTVKEIELVTYLNNALSSFFESGYTDIDCKDISEDLNWKVNSVKGVVGSLVKKGILMTVASSDISSDTYDLVLFKDQEEMVYEEVSAPAPSESAVDERLVNLNELKDTKLSSVSAKKRPFIKAQRVAAKYVIENWDDIKMLFHITNDKEFKAEQELVCKIAEDRLKELTPAEENKQPAEKSEKKHSKKVGRKTVRKVGDIHKNGLWEWKEYKPGKFDWRVIKK